MNNRFSTFYHHSGREYRREVRKYAAKLKRLGFPEKAKIWFERIRDW